MMGFGQLRAPTGACRESHLPPDSCSTPGVGPPREILVFRTNHGLPNSIRGLRAEPLTPPHFSRTESGPASTRWRYPGGGTRRPPPRSRSPIRLRPPARTQIRKVAPLPRPPEQLRYSPIGCTGRRSSALHPAPAARGQESPAHRSTQRIGWLGAWMATVSTDWQDPVSIKVRIRVSL